MDVLSRMCARTAEGSVRAVTYGYETIQANVIVAAAPAADFPVTVTALVPGDRPVPLIRPDGVMVRTVPEAPGSGVTRWKPTCSHCGSENALGQRVPVLPSTAAEEGKLAFSVDDAVAGWPSARLAVPQLGPRRREAARCLRGLGCRWRRIRLRTSTSFEIAAP
jgi:hypothetical protein